MRELGDDVTDTHTDTRTQPFIVKDDLDISCNFWRESEYGIGPG